MSWRHSPSKKTQVLRQTWTQSPITKRQNMTCPAREALGPAGLSFAETSRRLGSRSQGPTRRSSSEAEIEETAVSPWCVQGSLWMVCFAGNETDGTWLPLWNKPGIFWAWGCFRGIYGCHRLAASTKWRLQWIEQKQYLKPPERAFSYNHYTTVFPWCDLGWVHVPENLGVNARAQGF